MTAKFFFPNPSVPGDWDIGGSGILVPRDGTFSGNLQAGTWNGGALSGFRNRFRNGRGRIVTRGATLTGVTSGYTVDGYAITAVGGGVLTVAQSTDVPATSNLPFSVRATVTTADAAMAATDLYQIYQPIEGADVDDLVGNTFWIGSWVRSAKTGVHGVTVLSGGSDRCWVGSYTVNVANTWQWTTIQVTGGLDTSAGTWNFGAGIGLYAIFTMACGSNFLTSTVGSWQAANLRAPTAQVNCMDTVGNVFAIAGIRLERGTYMQPGVEEFIPIPMEIERNQRYLPAYAGGTVASAEDMCAGMVQGTSSNFFAFYDFKVPPRVPPSGVVVSSAAHFGFTTSTVAAAAASIAILRAGKAMALLTCTTAGAFGAANQAGVMYSQAVGAAMYFTGAEL